MSARDALTRLRNFNQAVRGRDATLADESLEGARADNLEALAPGATPEDQLQLESIVMKKQRPVLAIRDHETVLDFQDLGDSTVWKDRLEKAKPWLKTASRAVGRIDLTGSAYEWVGTGWLVHESIVVTNRHVANLFATRKNDGFAFQMGDQGTVGASVDFLQEINNHKQLVFTLKRPLFIQESGPDVAFFEIEMQSGNQSLAKAIRLANDVRTTNNAAVIGYPAYDSRIPDTALMEKIYGRVYNKKRLAPGGITKVGAARIWHDCTTLGGNSGSAVIDLDSETALGLHFSGAFLTTNYAVRADVVGKLLERVRSGRARPEIKSPAARPTVSSPAVTIGGDNRTARVTFPVTVTVSIGDAAPVTLRPAAPVASADDGADDISGDEAPVTDYRDREGYQEGFLGKKFSVPTPDADGKQPDVLTYDNDGTEDTVLRYEHFSVVMSKKRRMCFFSAVNIDGNLSKKSARVAWKWDPRIPKERQIMNECYGSPPRFSRGHMTRREDPGWGDDLATAKRGNQDSMHVTNTTPQMQSFNAPIWLALEDYALQHAREDDMKISVFTGPYFANNDPVMYGVKIPVAFWKIIVFIHDETKKLCATGYEMSQRKSLQPEEEFVFGQFVSPQLNTATQVSIASIARRSGLDFGDLPSIDPLAGDEEAIEIGWEMSPLQSVDQIRFLP